MQRAQAARDRDRSRDGPASGVAFMLPTPSPQPCEGRAAGAALDVFHGTGLLKGEGAQHHTERTGNVSDLGPRVLPPPVPGDQKTEVALALCCAAPHPLGHSERSVAPTALSTPGPVKGVEPEGDSALKYTHISTARRDSAAQDMCRRGAEPRLRAQSRTQLWAWLAQLPVQSPETWSGDTDLATPMCGPGVPSPGDQETSKVGAGSREAGTWGENSPRPCKSQQMQTQEVEA